jgi:hypothetical protein
MKWFGIMMPLGLGDGECIKREKRSRDSICMLLPVATLPNAFFFFEFRIFQIQGMGQEIQKIQEIQEIPKKYMGGVPGNRIKRA